MADPNFLNLEFVVEISPAFALLNSLAEFKKMDSKAAFNMTRDNMIQILIAKENPYRFAALDMNPDHTIATSNFNGFSLHFSTTTWHEALLAPTEREPSSSLSIRKSPGSVNLFCLFGDNHQRISLGEAEPSTIGALDSYTLHCCVGVTMTSQEFIQFMYAFSNIHDHRVSPVEMIITTSIIRWVTPAGYHDHPAQEFLVEGLTPEEAFQFRLSWIWPQYQVLCTASTSYRRVELCVLLTSDGDRYYRFRFLGNASNVFLYLEKEPLPPQ